MEKLAPPFSDPAITMNILCEEGPDLFNTLTQSATVMQVTVKTNGHPNLPHQVLLLNYGRADTWCFASDSFNTADLDGITKTTRLH